MFAKVFTQILDSSLAEDYRVRLVFEDFLKLSDKRGVVDMTPQSIARRTNVPLELVMKGIAELEGPDATSRTPDMEGRRIVRLDEHREWGWRIVNFEKYRESASREMLRMGEAERKREYRKKFPRSPSKKTDTEAEADMSAVVPDTSRTPPEQDKKLTRYFPEPLRDQSFVARFEEWEQHLSELSRPLGSSARRGQLVDCERNGRDVAMKALLFSISNNRNYIAWDWQRDATKRNDKANGKTPPVTL